MDFEKIIIVILVVFCAIVMASVSNAATIEQCKLEQPYRCVPTYGNKILCGCGL
jgi:hypothetical protein